MADRPGAPRVCSLRTIKSDVVVGLGDQGNEIAGTLDKAEPGWKARGKYVCAAAISVAFRLSDVFLHRQCACCPKVDRETEVRSAYAGAVLYCRVQRSSWYICIFELVGWVVLSKNSRCLMEGATSRRDITPYVRFEFFSWQSLAQGLQPRLQRVSSTVQLSPPAA